MNERFSVTQVNDPMVPVSIPEQVPATEVFYLIEFSRAGKVPYSEFGRRRQRRRRFRAVPSGTSA